MIVLDPDNAVVKLCAEGMDHEGDGTDRSMQLFNQAWGLASTPSEKMIAAHYMARLQNTAADKLTWDQRALDEVLNVADDSLRGALASLHLNVAKCYEDLGDIKKATTHYQLAESATVHLSDDGYGQFTRSAIQRGLERIQNN